MKRKNKINHRIVVPLFASLCIVLSFLVIQKIASESPSADTRDDTPVTTLATTPIVAGLHAPTGLKINGLSEAYGVPADGLTFSWVMNDGDKNQLQTAYEIIISSTLDKVNAGKTDILDTGKVVSGESSYVKISKLKLSDNCLYYWKVRVWNSAGSVSDYSKASPLTTAVGSNWAGSETIWAGNSDSTKSSGWDNYVIELDMNITSVASGINFRDTNGTSFYMWQFNTDKNILTPTICTNGSYSTLGAVNLAKSNVKITPNTYFHVKIVLVGNSITAYVNGQKVDKRSLNNFSYGTIGFRNGATESAEYKNIRVYKTDSKGNINKYLYRDRFASGVNPFSGSTISGSALNLNKSQNVTYSEDTGSYIKPKQDFVFLRTEFNIKDKSAIQKAVVSIASTSSKNTKQHTYDLYLNGSSVGVGPCIPTSQEIRYNTYDVTSLLNNGNNAIGSINYATSGKQFILQMTVYYKDGTSAVLLNSGRDFKNWRSLDGTAIYGEDASVGTFYYNQAAENINATLYPYGWNSTGYNASGWQQPIISGKPLSQNTLVPSTDSNVKKYTGNAVKVVNNGNGNYFIDFGKEVIGGLSLNVTSGSVSKVTVRCGEEKSGSSGVLYKTKAGNCYTETWTLKKGEQTISNFGIKTFRYVEILNSPVEITTKNIHSISLRQAFDDNDSGFISSNSSLNNIYNVCKYSIKETNQSLQVDSQSRERSAYQGDAFVNMLSSFTVDPDSTLSEYTVEYLNHNSSWPAEYKLLSVMLTYDYYLYTGDLDIVKKYYGTLKNNNLYETLYDQKYNLIKRANTGISNQDSVLVDWPISERDGYDTADAEYNTVENAVAYGAYTDIVKMANALGNKSDAAIYADKAAKIKNAMIKYLYNSSKGAFSDGLTQNGTRIEHYSQHASAYSLAFGVVSDKSAKNAVTAFIGEPGSFKTSVYGALFVLSGLYNADAGDTAIKLLTSNDTRSWNHMINTLGATITAEAWDSSIKPNLTYSHPWGTGALSQLATGLFGIQPTSAGYSTFQIKFQPGGLASAGIKVPTVKGAIFASFKTSSGFSSTAVIPANTKASVYIPVSSSYSSKTLLVDGKKVAAQRVDNYLMIELGSGRYTVSLH